MKLKEPLLSTSFGKQVWMYFLAVFFPIFTIVPGIRYIRQVDNTSKSVGIVLLLLTGISLLVEVYFAVIFMQYFSQYYQMLSGSTSIIEGAEVGSSLYNNLSF